MADGGFVLLFALLIVVGTVGYMITVSSDVPLPQILGRDRVVYNETGYVDDIDFLGGGFLTSSQTVIRFTDGDVVTLQGWKTKIPVKQNVTLHYHDNGFGVCFLDEFVKLEK